MGRGSIAEGRGLRGVGKELTPSPFGEGFWEKAV